MSPRAKYIANNLSGAVLDSIVPQFSTAGPEPAWHRNQRTRRQRARSAVKAAKSGAAVDSNRLAAAVALLATHHGTRGNNEEMPGKQNRNG